MLFGDAGITQQQFADEFVAKVLTKMDGAVPPCAGGERKSWSDAIFQVLKQMGEARGYEDCYPWLADWIWWSRKDEHFALAAESELDKNSVNVEDDFYKLTVLKCPLKVLIYSAGDPEPFKSLAEQYLKKRGQHIKDEEYLLIALTGDGTRCYGLKIPNDGRCDDLRLEPLNLRRTQASS